MSRQAAYSRCVQSEVAEIGPLPPIVHPTAAVEAANLPPLQENRKMLPPKFIEAPGLSTDQLAAEAAFNEQHAELAGELNQLAELKAQALAVFDAVSVEELRARAVAIDDAELYAAQDALSLSRQAVQLLGERLPQLRSHQAKQESQLEKTGAVVGKKLHAAGISVASMPAAPHNLPAAEVQFQHEVRKSADWQSANAAVEDARASIENCLAQIQAAEARVTAAKAACLAATARIVGQPVPDGRKRIAAWQRHPGVPVRGGPGVGFSQTP